MKTATEPIQTQETTYTKVVYQKSPTKSYKVKDDAIFLYDKLNVCGEKGNVLTLYAKLCGRENTIFIIINLMRNVLIRIDG